MLDALITLYPNAKAIEWNPDLPDVATVDGVEVQITQAIKDSQTLEAKKNSERAWRDSELKDSDLQIVQALAGEMGQNLGALKSYRQALRDYPASQDFPNGQRPSL